MEFVGIVANVRAEGVAVVFVVFEPIVMLAFGLVVVFEVVILAVDVGEGVAPMTVPEIGIKEEIVSGKIAFDLVASVEMIVLGSEFTIGD